MGMGEYGGRIDVGSKTGLFVDEEAVNGVLFNRLVDGDFGKM